MKKAWRGEGGTYLCRVEDEGADVSMAFALNLVDCLGRCYTCDHDVALLLEIEDEWKAKRRVSAQNDCMTCCVSNVKGWRLRICPPEA